MLTLTKKEKRGLLFSTPVVHASRSTLHAPHRIPIQEMNTYTFEKKKKNSFYLAKFKIIHVLDFLVMRTMELAVEIVPIGRFHLYVFVYLLCRIEFLICTVTVVLEI